MLSSNTSEHILVTQKGAVTTLFAAALREEALLGVKAIGLSLPTAPKCHAALRRANVAKSKRIRRNKTDSPPLLSIWIQVSETSYSLGISTYINLQNSPLY